MKWEYKLPLFLQYAFHFFFFRRHEYTGGLVGKLCIFDAHWNIWDVVGNCFGGVKYFVAFVSPTFERLGPFFWTEWKGEMMQFQFMEHLTFDLDVADFVMINFQDLYLHPFNFLVMNFIYDFAKVVTQILRMMRKEEFSVLHFERIRLCFMTIFFSSFHILQAFLYLVWNSFLWILAFHICHVILCGKVPLIIVPGVIGICRFLRARKSVFDGKDPSACSGMRFSSYCMVIFLSDVLKLEDWHRWFYFLFLLYILESITYLILYLTRQMFLIIHLIITHLWTSCFAFGLRILKSAMCLWMGIIMGITFFRQLLQDIMELSITAFVYC